MKKKENLLFMLFCFCAFLFSMSASASTSVTLDKGSVVTFSKEPVGTVSVTYQYIASADTATNTVYLLEKGTKISLPDDCEKWYFYWLGISPYYNDIIYEFTAEADGEESLLTISGDVTYRDATTLDSDGNLLYFYGIQVFDGEYLFFAVADADSSVSSVKLTPKLTNASSGIKVSWNQAAGATGYYVYRKTSSAKSYTKIKTIKSGSTLSYTDTAVKSKNGTTYLYKVIPYSGSKKGSSNATKIVRLTAPTLTSLKNIAKKKITVKWKKDSKATGFQIQYSRSSSFATGSTKTRKFSGASTVKYNLTGLTKGAKYYVRIRAYKTVSGKTYYSAWSSKKSVKISK